MPTGKVKKNTYPKKFERHLNTWTEPLFSHLLSRIVSSYFIIFRGIFLGNPPLSHRGQVEMTGGLPSITNHDFQPWLSMIKNRDSSSITTILTSINDYWSPVTTINHENHYGSTTNQQHSPWISHFYQQKTRHVAIGPLGPGVHCGKLCHRPGHQLHQHLGAKSHQRDQLPGPLVGIFFGIAMEVAMKTWGKWRSSRFCWDNLGFGDEF